MSGIELAATIFGVLSVGFTIARSIWCWPTGLAMVALYIVIFWDARLYSDMGLQVVYVFLQIYGWYHWVAHRTADEELVVERLPIPHAFGWLAVATLGTLALGGGMSRWTDAALPYWDATTTVLSLIAQWLMARRIVESWVVWVVVDVLSIGIYYQRELFLTTGLYALFLAMAVGGLAAWAMAWARQEEAK